jgi:hypothetical protein
LWPVGPRGNLIRRKRDYETNVRNVELLKVVEIGTRSLAYALGAFTIAGELWRFSQPTGGGQCAGSLWVLS